MKQLFLLMVVSFSSYAFAQSYSELTAVAESQYLHKTTIHGLTRNYRLTDPVSSIIVNAIDNPFAERPALAGGEQYVEIFVYSRYENLNCYAKFTHTTLTYIDNCDVSLTSEGVVLDRAEVKALNEAELRRHTGH